MGGPPIDRGWAWACVLGSHLGNMFLIGGFKSLGVLIVELTDAFDAPLAEATVMLGLIGGFMSILSPLGTALGDRYTNRMVVMVGGVFMALGAFTTSFAVSMMMAILMFGFFTGVGYGLVFGPANVVVGLYFRNRRSLASGMAVAGGSIGQLLIPLLLRKLIDVYGWRGALFIYSAIMLHVVMGAMLFRPLSFYDEKPNRNQQKEAKPVKEKPGNRLTESETGNTSHSANTGQRCNEDIITEESKPMLQSDNIHAKGINSKNQDDTAICTNGNLLRSGVKINGSGNECEGRVTSAVISDLKCYSKPQYTSTGSLCFYPFKPDCNDDCLQTQTLGGKSELVKPQTSFIDVLKVSFCICCLKKDSIPQRESLFDWSLFRNCLFLVYIIGVCLGNTGCINLFMFIPKHSEDLGFNRQDAALLLSIGGVCDLVSRVAGGWFADLGLVRRNNIMAVSILCLGIATFVFPNIASFPALVVYVMMVGSMGGIYAALFIVVLIDLVGLERLPKAFGTTLMAIGLVNMPMPVLLGYLRDRTGDCIASFSVCGGIMVLCSICFFSEPLVRRLEERRLARLQQDEETQA